jgi:hypothetical protein
MTPFQECRHEPEGLWVPSRSSWEIMDTKDAILAIPLYALQKTGG